MKALTLTQPWATLIALGAKTFETRGWATSHRGPLAIHAAKGFSDLGKRGFLEICAQEPFASVLAEARLTPADLPLGEVIVIASLRQCATTESVRKYLRQSGLHDELAFGDYGTGRFAFELVDVVALPHSVAATGALGLWELPRTLLAGLQPAAEAA